MKKGIAVMLIATIVILAGCAKTPTTETTPTAETVETTAVPTETTTKEDSLSENKNPNNNQTTEACINQLPRCKHTRYET